MELQRGNSWAAVKLLERCVDLNPACMPVLRWQLVSAARAAVMGSESMRQTTASPPTHPPVFRV